MNIIAYAFEADYHCIDCTRTRFNPNTLNAYHPEQLNDEHGIPTNPKGLRGSYGLVELVDREGNQIHPLFSTDEWQELDESYLAENPIQYLACGDCHEVIKEYTHLNN